MTGFQSEQLNYEKSEDRPQAQKNVDYTTVSQLLKEKLASKL